MAHIEHQDPTTSLMKDESREIVYEYPIVYWVGWFSILYFVLYFVTYQIGPAIFNTRPPTWFRRRRSVDKNHTTEEDLMSTITKAIDNALYN